MADAIIAVRWWSSSCVHKSCVVVYTGLDCVNVDRNFGWFPNLCQRISVCEVNFFKIFPRGAPTCVLEVQNSIIDLWFIFLQDIRFYDQIFSQKSLLIGQTEIKAMIMVKNKKLWELSAGWLDFFSAHISSMSVNLSIRGSAVYLVRTTKHARWPR